MKRIHLKDTEILKDSELIVEQANWTGQQWHDYFTQEGEMSIDEFNKLAKEIVLKKFEEKYGEDPK